jgi:DNA-binding MarR family transcriptional regulator
VEGQSTLSSMKRSRAATVAEAAQELSRIANALDSHSKRLQSKYGVTGPQLGALSEVSENRGLTVSQVARRMYLHPSTISGIADRLQAKGLLRRVRDRKDQRIVHLQITERGLALLNTAPQPTRQRILQTLEQLPESELRALAKGMSALAEAIEAEGRPSVTSASHHVE